MVKDAFARKRRRLAFVIQMLKGYPFALTRLGTQENLRVTRHEHLVLQDSWHSH